MVEITAIHVSILAGSVAVGAVIGWIVRGTRCAQEKMAVNEGWQQQLEAQRTEDQRLLEQNKSLMEQISQIQASGKDATNRARELSEALKEAFERRDELQRELKEIRSNLEVAVRQRDQLQSDKQDTEARGDSAQAALKERDDKIFRLSRELENWQDRLPPLLERYRVRNEEASQFEEELEAARERIEALEDLLDSGETRVEPVDPDTLGDELDASNDPTSMTQTGITDILAEEADDETAVAKQIEDDDADAETAVTEQLTGDVADDDETAVTEQIADDDADDDETAVTEQIEDDDADDGAADAETADDDGADTVAADADSETDAVEASAIVAELYDHGPGSLRDDLKLIKGVGPAIEKTLNELGIFRFDQIAEMSEYDIDRVAQRLKGFRSRIYREDWIGQARDLQLQKSGT